MSRNKNYHNDQDDLNTPNELSNSWWIPNHTDSTIQALGLHTCATLPSKHDFFLFQKITPRHTAKEL